MGIYQCALSMYLDDIDVSVTPKYNSLQAFINWTLNRDTQSGLNTVSPDTSL